jgi:hypothetical protein
VAFADRLPRRRITAVTAKAKSRRLLVMSLLSGSWATRRLDLKGVELTTRFENTRGEQAK